MARNKYQSLVAAKARFCRGEVLKSDVKRAAANYVHGAAVKSDDQVKARKAAQKIANRVLQRGCKTTSVITGRKKKKSAKRRSKKRK
jgi:hypothetical protein